MPNHQDPVEGIRWYNSWFTSYTARAAQNGSQAFPLAGGHTQPRAAHSPLPTSKVSGEGTHDEPGGGDRERQQHLGAKQGCQSSSLAHIQPRTHITDVEPPSGGPMRAQGRARDEVATSTKA
jgi:hypothetical protein